MWCVTLETAEGVSEGQQDGEDGQAATAFLGQLCRCHFAVQLEYRATVTPTLAKSF